MTVSLRRDAIAERVQRVAELTGDGWSAPEIAKVLSTSVRSVQRYRGLAGVAEMKHPLLTDDELRRAAALLEDGCCYAEVARTLGRSWSAIASRFPGYSWGRSECSSFAMSVRLMEERLQGVYA